MIRILVVDDHPALRAGLESVLCAEPGLVPTGAACDEYQLWPLLQRSDPDVVLVDYHLPVTDGLLLWRRLKERALAPKVLVYSAYAGAELAVPAMLAGADGIVHKGVPARELYNAVRTVAAGGTLFPELSPPLVEAASTRLDERDRPLFDMLLDRTPPLKIAQALGIYPEKLPHRIEGVISRLRVEAPVSVT